MAAEAAQPIMMLGLGGFPRLCASYDTTSTFSLLFPSKALQTHVSLLSRNASSASSFFSSVHRLREPQSGFRVVLGRGRIRFSVSARKRQGRGPSTLLEMDGIGDDGDEDDDEEEFIPFADMKKWFQNKPSGFGEGKVYDTRIEDKLLEEMEQSRVAQLANINNLKNSPVNPSSKKASNQFRTAPETVLNAFHVRLFNLPKKKNIHRDLQLAFKGVPGIVNIIPVVSGNKKTRDPVCKGFAFVDLKTEDDANRFLHIFSRQSITFGKIQKQIKCEITSSLSSNVAYEQSADCNYADPLSTVSSEENPALGFGKDDCPLDSWEGIASNISDGEDDLEGDTAADLNMDITSLDTWKETTSEESNATDEERHITVEWEDGRENLESFSISEMDGDDRLEPRMEATDSLSSKRLEEIWTLEKKPLAKRDGEKVLKLKLRASELNDCDSDDQEMGAATDSSLRYIRALERRLLARERGGKTSNLNDHAVEKNFGDSMDPRLESTANSSASKGLESIRELERRLLARGKQWKVPKLDIPVSVLNGGDSKETRDEPTTDSFSSKRLKKKQKLEKRLIAKRKGENAPGSNIPGSANRLKIREKVMLTDVLSKYGVKSANT